MPSTDLIGRAKELEVASALVRNGIYSYHPLVDTGIDLVASNRAGSKFIPIQVKYRAKDPALNLYRSDIARYREPNTVLVFLIGDQENLRTWYIPFAEWYSRSIDPGRADNRIYVQIRENSAWLTNFEGDEGLRRTFAVLFE